GGEKDRCAISKPISVHRSFDRSHMRPYFRFAPSDRIKVVAAERKIVRGRQIEPADMSVAIKTYITGSDIVLAGVTDQRRADEKAVRIIMNSAAVVVKGGDRLYRIAFSQKVLVIEIGDVNILTPRVKCI